MLIQAAVLAVLAAPPAAAAEAATADPAKTYATSCASCHGKTGKGNPALAKPFKVGLDALDLVDKATLEKSDEDLRAMTEKGRGKMPGFKGKLGDEQTAAVIGYVRSLAPKPEAEKK